MNSPLSGSTDGSINGDHAAWAVLWTESLLVRLCMTAEGAPPNKRLKLPGGDRFKGSGVLCAWRGTDFVHQPCAGGRVARSLSAIR